MHARSFIHELKTAPTAPMSCSRGSVGNSRPVRSRTSFLKRRVSSLSEEASSSVSETFFLPGKVSFLSVSITTSNGSWCSPVRFCTPMTTSPYIWTKRR